MTPDVIIIGAGPVGLLLGALLGHRKLRVLILEKRMDPPEQSQAIGITPPSLEIMATLGLAERLVDRGVCIRQCHVHGHTGRLGRVSFAEIEGPYRFILSLPQRETMRLLETHVRAQENVTLIRGVEVVGITQQPDGVRVSAAGHPPEYSAAFAVACDGARSRVRGLLDIRTRRHDYGCHFVMGDFIDRTGLQDEAHVFFTAAGAVESFPLPDGRRRWIVQAEEPDELVPQVRQRVGTKLAPADLIQVSTFSPWRLDCQRMHHGRVLLCGDAAHVMSPIGGQGMNTGFADAEWVAEMMPASLRNGEPSHEWMNRYDRCRGLAARTAARRASWGMGLGVWRGVGRSLVRDFVLSQLVLKGPLSRQVAPWFAMQNLPFNRFHP